MSKKRIRENFRVEITPRDLYIGARTEQQSVDACEQIASQVKRHIDDIGGVYAQWDSKEVCEFCGGRWTEDGDYNGGCCDRDVAAEDARLAAQGAA